MSVSEARAAEDAADLTKNLGSRTEQKMIGIGEEDLGTRVVKEIRRLGFHRRMRADRHEQRGADLVVKSAKSRRAGAGLTRAGV